MERFFFSILSHIQLDVIAVSGRGTWLYPHPAKMVLWRAAVLLWDPQNPRNSSPSIGSHESMTTGLLSVQAWAAPSGLKHPKNPLRRCFAGGGMQRRTLPVSKDPVVPWLLAPRLPGYALTESGACRDDPVPRFQRCHTTPDLQHFPNTFVPSHGRQRGEDGVGPCQETRGELWKPSYPRPPHPRSRLQTLRDIPPGASRKNQYAKKMQLMRYLGSY